MVSSLCGNNCDPDLGFHWYGNKMSIKKHRGNGIRVLHFLGSLSQYKLLRSNLERFLNNSYGRTVCYSYGFRIGANCLGKSITGVKTKSNWCCEFIANNKVTLNHTIPYLTTRETYPTVFRRLFLCSAISKPRQLRVCAWIAVGTRSEMISLGAAYVSKTENWQMIYEWDRPRSA